MDRSRLEKQMEYIVELDRLKHVLRRSRPIASDRLENDAEHTWHLTVMAVVLLEHAASPKPDLLKVLKMLIVHDVVEIDAGDTFAYDEQGHSDKFERERKAAERIFGLLPEDQKEECIALWLEFEEGLTPESRYAAAIDRLHPMLLNFNNQGQSWREHGVTSDKVLKRNCTIELGSPVLWEYAQDMIGQAVEKGYLSEPDNKE